jgi:hypothetical protein
MDVSKCDISHKCSYASQFDAGRKYNAVTPLQREPPGHQMPNFSSMRRKNYTAFPLALPVKAEAGTDIGSWLEGFRGTEDY